MARMYDRLVIGLADHSRSVEYFVYGVNVDDLLGNSESLYRFAEAKGFERDTVAVKFNHVTHYVPPRSSDIRYKITADYDPSAHIN